MSFAEKIPFEGIPTVYFRFLINIYIIKYTFFHQPHADQQQPSNLIKATREQSKLLIFVLVQANRNHLQLSTRICNSFAPKFAY